MKEVTEVCVKCGRLFQYIGFGGKYCRTCRELDDIDFAKVKKYIKAHGTATMMEVVVATGVHEKDVRRYLRESRLEIPDNSPIFIKCENCGCDIKSGRYCMDCAMKIGKNLKSVYAEVGEKPKERKGEMRFLNKINKND